VGNHAPKAPTYGCSLITHLKVVDSQSDCFSDNYQLGLHVLRMVEAESLLVYPRRCTQFMEQVAS